MIPSPEPTPNVPIASSLLQYESYATGTRFGGRSIALGKLGGARLVGVNLDEIAPGKQSCPFHFPGAARAKPRLLAGGTHGRTPRRDPLARRGRLAT